MSISTSAADNPKPTASQPPPAPTIKITQSIVTATASTATPNDQQQQGQHHHHLQALRKEASTLTPCSVASGNLRRNSLVEDKNILSKFKQLSVSCGFRSSFSWSDFQQMDCERSRASSLQQQLKQQPPSQSAALRIRSRSESQIDECVYSRLDESSRSLSTWVAIGDASLMSQIHSPKGNEVRCSSAASTSSSFLPPAELVRSISKHQRNAYLRKLLMKTRYKVEKLTKSGYGEAAAAAAAAAVAVQSGSKGPNAPAPTSSDECSSSSSSVKLIPGRKNYATDAKAALSTMDIDRDRGRPLTNYQRNLIIFDWLYNIRR